MVAASLGGDAEEAEEEQRRVVEVSGGDDQLWSHFSPGGREKHARRERAARAARGAAARAAGRSGWAGHDGGVLTCAGRAVGVARDEPPGRSAAQRTGAVHHDVGPIVSERRACAGRGLSQKGAGGRGCGRRRADGERRGRATERHGRRARGGGECY
jgi:hypothetical protein